MKSKDIKIGETYRVAANQRGTGFYKAVVENNAITEKRWDRKTMEYKSVVTKASIKKTDSYGIESMAIVRLNAFIEPWAEFAERMPKEAAQYELNRSVRSWENVRDDYLREIGGADRSVYLNAGYYGRTRYAVRVEMTLEEYLTFVGKTMAEYEEAVGPKPVAEEVAA